MKSFSEWPLDGLASFILIILSLGLLIISGFLRSPVAMKDGRYIFVPGKKEYFQILGATLMAGVVLYGVSQSGYCNIMTKEENLQNFFAGVGVAVFMIFGLLYLIYIYLFVKISFDRNGIVKSGFRGTDTFLFENLQGIAPSNGGLCLIFNDGKKLRLAENVWGTPLQNIINAKLMDRDSSLNPYFDEVLAEKLLNKRVFVISLFLNTKLESEVDNTFLGKIERADLDGIFIRCADNSVFKAFPDLKSFEPVSEYDDDGYYKEYGVLANIPNLNFPDKGSYDFIAVFYIQKGDVNEH